MNPCEQFPIWFYNYDNKLLVYLIPLVYKVYMFNYSKRLIVDSTSRLNVNVCNARLPFTNILKMTPLIEVLLTVKLIKVEFQMKLSVYECPNVTQINNDGKLGILNFRVSEEDMRYAIKKAQNQQLQLCMKLHR